MRSRPIGALLMEDEAGPDEKILAVPVDALHPYYRDVQSYKDLPEVVIDQIKHFFGHYKDLEAGKWVKGLEFTGVPQAHARINDALARAAGS